MSGSAALADEKTLRKLDYFKITSLLEKECSSELGKNAAGELRPITSAHFISLLQQESKEALWLLEVDGDIPLGGIDRKSTR